MIQLKLNLSIVYTLNVLQEANHNLFGNSWAYTDASCAPCQGCVPKSSTIYAPCTAISSNNAAAQTMCEIIRDANGRFEI